jgi:hypothetical protein
VNEDDAGPFEREPNYLDGDFLHRIATLEPRHRVWRHLGRAGEAVSAPTESLPRHPALHWDNWIHGATQPTGKAAVRGGLQPAPSCHNWTRLIYVQMMLFYAKMKYILTIVFPQHTSRPKKPKRKRQPRRRSSATGRDAMERFLDFLIGQFTFLGFEFQYWMPVFMGAVAIYLLYLWRIGQFSK